MLELSPTDHPVRMWKTFLTVLLPPPSCFSQNQGSIYQKSFSPCSSIQWVLLLFLVLKSEKEPLWCNLNLIEITTHISLRQVWQVCSDVPANKYEKSLVVKNNQEMLAAGHWQVRLTQRQRLQRIVWQLTMIHPTATELRSDKCESFGNELWLGESKTVGFVQLWVELRTYIAKPLQKETSPQIKT